MRYEVKPNKILGIISTLIMLTILLIIPYILGNIGPHVKREYKNTYYILWIFVGIIGLFIITYGLIITTQKKKITTDKKGILINHTMIGWKRDYVIPWKAVEKAVIQGVPTLKGFLSQKQLIIHTKAYHPTNITEELFMGRHEAIILANETETNNFTELIEEVSKHTEIMI